MSPPENMDDSGRAVSDLKRALRLAIDSRSLSLREVARLASISVDTAWRATSDSIATPPSFEVVSKILKVCGNPRLHDGRYDDSWTKVVTAATIAHRISRIGRIRKPREDSTAATYPPINESEDGNPQHWLHYFIIGRGLSNHLVMMPASSEAGGHDETFPEFYSSLQHVGLQNDMLQDFEELATSLPTLTVTQPERGRALLTQWHKTISEAADSLVATAAPAEYDWFLVGFHLMELARCTLEKDLTVRQQMLDNSRETLSHLCQNMQRMIPSRRDVLRDYLITIGEDAKNETVRVGAESLLHQFYVVFRLTSDPTYRDSLIKESRDGDEPGPEIRASSEG